MRRHTQPRSIQPGQASDKTCPGCFIFSFLIVLILYFIPENNQNQDLNTLYYR